MENNLLHQLFSLLPENPTTAEIEKAYKALAQNFHPDKNLERKEWANEKMKQLNEAKEYLMDPVRRAEFVQNLKNNHGRETIHDPTVNRLKNENLLLRKSLQKSNQTAGAMALLILIGILASQD